MARSGAAAPWIDYHPPMAKILQTYVVPKSLGGQPLDRIIEGLLGDVSRSQAQKLVRKGQVLVRGKRVVRSNGRIPKGTEVSIESDAPKPEVLHEDESLLVVQKPAGLLTHGIDGTQQADLATELNKHYGPLPDSRGDERPGIVHRLDRETSGVLVVARTEAALLHLQDQFRDRTVTKRYLALVSGVLHQESVLMDLSIGPVPGKADRQQVDHERGKEARTEARSLEALGQHSLLECQIFTGRRHQIRVHLAEQGYPVLADPMYGTKRQIPLPDGVPAPPRLALHAAMLGFDHPVTAERMEFETPLPADLAKTRDALRRLG